jgi:hypothetical protein
MKSKHTQGTAEWFEDARRQCIDHLRALLSVQLAHDSIKQILLRWGAGKQQEGNRRAIKPDLHGARLSK